jgi:hypothetical protein
MRIQNCAARTANIKVEFSVVRTGYIKKEQIHGGGAGKQEIHTGLRVGNVSKKKKTHKGDAAEGGTTSHL